MLYILITRIKETAKQTRSQGLACDVFGNRFAVTQAERGCLLASTEHEESGERWAVGGERDVHG